ncbi:NitT/TauT family transport system substrate-binding protein [Bosea sp. BE125]|uniref:ABC transporter substrate-binding protein n=1 Tax=Bosea sp. BE125 TaxID=2817909 RepID=UPI002856CB93|nr:ABC transporter substrate-binding protein [Bosea sp. BE125]MDR6874938.1 NitT/TauT family transport system substrate-binding protein [Bosea sp. BE125]
MTITRRTITRRLAALLTGAALTLAISAPGAMAEVKEVRISKGYGILYLPLIVMQDQKLLEKQAAKAGLGDVATKWLVLDGGNVINDAMMAGTLDFAGTGAPGFVTLWSKAKGIPNVEVIGIGGMSATSLSLNSINPNVKSLKDFTAKDKIALPGIKTSLSAVVLQMMVAKEFGRENFAKLDPMTVSLPHPEALAALTSGKTEITAHFTSPPFSFLELNNPKVHLVADSIDVIGNITLDVVFAPKKFVDANPKMTAAFLAALDEACDFIAQNKDAAAEIFVRGSPVKVSKDEVLTMLNDKGAKFSTTPDKVMDFAEFMGLAGTIKVKPAKWTDMFIPQIHDRKGS